jgi:hypothetical protein
MYLMPQKLFARSYLGAGIHGVPVLFISVNLVKSQD